MIDSRVYFFCRPTGASSSCSTCTLGAYFLATSTAGASLSSFNIRHASWRRGIESVCSPDWGPTWRRWRLRPLWNMWPKSGLSEASTVCTLIVIYSPNATSNIASCMWARQSTTLSLTSGWIACPPFLSQVRGGERSPSNKSERAPKW